MIFQTTLVVICPVLESLRGKKSIFIDGGDVFWGEVDFFYKRKGKSIHQLPRCTPLARSPPRHHGFVCPSFPAEQSRVEQSRQVAVACSSLSTVLLSPHPLHLKQPSIPTRSPVTSALDPSARPCVSVPSASSGWPDPPPVVTD
jgi:hypothetical protein